MPLLLTTPKGTGDLDPNNPSYTHLKIIFTKHDALAGYVTLFCSFGIDDGYGNWTDGILPAVTHQVTDTDYDNMLLELSNDGETAYQAVSRVLYEYLIDNAIYSGTYV